MTWDKTGNRQLSRPGLTPPSCTSFYLPELANSESEGNWKSSWETEAQKGGILCQITQHTQAKQKQSRTPGLDPRLDLPWPSLCSENKLLFEVQRLTQTSSVIMRVFQMKTPGISSAVRSLTKHGTYSAPTARHPPHPTFQHITADSYFPRTCNLELWSPKVQVQMHTTSLTRYQGNSGLII